MLISLCATYILTSHSSSCLALFAYLQHFHGHSLATFQVLINFPIDFLAVKVEFVLLSEDVMYLMIKDYGLQESALHYTRRIGR